MVWTLMDYPGPCTHTRSMQGTVLYCSILGASETDGVSSLLKGSDQIFKMQTRDSQACISNLEFTIMPTLSISSSDSLAHCTNRNTWLETLHVHLILLTWDRGKPRINKFLLAYIMLRYHKEQKQEYIDCDLKNIVKILMHTCRGLENIIGM